MRPLRIERIERLEDPRVAVYRNVRDADLRRDSGLFMAEGRLNVERLIRGARFRTRSLLLTEAALRGISGTLDAIDLDAPVYLAEQALLNRVVGYDLHRGCLAAGERGGGAPFAELAAAARLLVVLEDVTNPDNVGGVFRNAMAFGVDAVGLTARCTDPLYRKSIRVSMGGALRVPFARIPDLDEVLHSLGAAGHAIVALTPARDAVPLAALIASALPPRRVLLLGNEGEGLSEAALARADWRVSIPMVEGVDSLNVATSSGIALHHLAMVAAPPSGAER